MSLMKPRKSGSVLTAPSPTPSPHLLFPFDPKSEKWKTMKFEEKKMIHWSIYILLFPTHTHTHIYIYIKV